MTNQLPNSVLRYLKTIAECNRSIAYLCLNDSNIIVGSGGDLEKCGVLAVKNGTPINAQLPPITQLLPLGEKAVVIANTQLSKSTIIDLHLFADSEGQWILMFDNTEASIKLQSEQQERLTNDIIEEQNSKKSGTR